MKKDDFMGEIIDWLWIVFAVAFIVIVWRG